MIDKEWDDYLSGYSKYGESSPRFGPVNDLNINNKVTRISSNEVHVAGGSRVIGSKSVLDFYFGKGGKK